MVLLPSLIKEGPGVVGGNWVSCFRNQPPHQAEGLYLDLSGTRMHWAKQSETTLSPVPMKNGIR